MKVLEQTYNKNEVRCFILEREFNNIIFFFSKSHSTARHESLFVFFQFTVGQRNDKVKNYGNKSSNAISISKKFVQ